MQPHFFFLVTPPYTGSTAIAKIIATSERTMLLSPNGEGQWIVPGLCEKDRWDPNKKVNYESVKAVWLSTFQEQNKLNPHIDVVIEKSPPNLIRIEQLSSLFSNCSFLANNRDPYAHCASILYRSDGVKSFSTTKRMSDLNKIARQWIVMSNKLKEFISKNEINLLTYEQFCQNPTLILEMLNLPEGVASTIDVNAKVKVKDYEAQPISNQNARQISKLSNAEIEGISVVLESERALLEFYGYAII